MGEARLSQGSWCLEGRSGRTGFECSKVAFAETAFGPDGQTDCHRFCFREICKTEYARPVRCRVVGPGPKDGTYLLQAVELGDKADLVPAKVWSGMAGLASKLFPSSIVLAAFGSSQDALIVGFDDSLPLELSLDAITSITVGGEGAMPLVLAPGLKAAVDAAAAAAGVIVGPVSGPALQTILQAISTALAASQTIKTKAI